MTIVRTASNAKAFLWLGAFGVLSACTEEARISAPIQDAVGSNHDLPWPLAVDAMVDESVDPTATADGGTLANDMSGEQAQAGGCRTFDSSFAAIQALIFERHGCTAAACHGQAMVGGLDLRSGASWPNLVDAPSVNSSTLKRIQPGTPGDSLLFQKLQAATDPGSVQVAGSPMPIGVAPLSAGELEAVKLWIAKGAPKTGVVSDPLKPGIDVGSLLDACLPAVTPVKIKPLEPPAPDEGFQIRLPPYVLKAGSEVEQCIPFAYDFTDRVPAKFKDEARNVIYTNGSRVRQDPQSHHMVVWNPNQDTKTFTAKAGEWSCMAGPSAGKACDPKKGSADCGDGVCAGKAVPGTFCNGDITPLVSGGLPTFESLAAIFELFSQSGGGLPGQIASTQTPQQYTPPLAGVFTEIPLRGVVWFNSHAFNLTEADTLLEARVNYEYAQVLNQEMRLVTDASHVYIADGTPPFTRATYCAKSVVPQHYRIATLASHTHRRGEHFWVKDATGKQIYESFDYSDPIYLHFEPFLAFDQADEASRTLEYCATYNNGLTKQDEPDLALVTRASRMPERTSCKPVACVAGKVAKACTTDRDCDSAAGANDGDCDACPITGGPTTENEMFALMPWFVMPPTQ